MSKHSIDLDIYGRRDLDPHVVRVAQIFTIWKKRLYIERENVTNPRAWWDRPSYRNIFARHRVTQIFWRKLLLSYSSFAESLSKSS